MKTTLTRTGDRHLDQWLEEADHEARILWGFGLEESNLDLSMGYNLGQSPSAALNLAMRFHS